MSTVRAKFFVTAVTERTNAQGIEKIHEVTLAPVIGGSEENKQFFRFTPYGELKLGTVNPEVAKVLEVGKTFYLDITPAD